MTKRRLSKSKKGNLGISTNAIVVLIIAVVMLGLIVGFIKTMFGDITKDFEEATTNEEPAPMPSTANPITLSRSAVSTEPGKAEVMKVKAKNTGSDPIVVGENVLSPRVICRGEYGNMELSREFTMGYDSDWAPGEVIEFNYNFRVRDDATLDTTYDCKLKIYNGCLEVDGVGMPDCGTESSAADVGLKAADFRVKI